MTLTIETPAIDPVELVRQSAGYRKAQEAAAQVLADEREAAVQNLIRVRAAGAADIQNAVAALHSAERELADAMPAWTALARKLDRVRSERTGTQARVESEVARAESACRVFALPQALVILRKIAESKVEIQARDYMRLAEADYAKIVARMDSLNDLESRTATIALLPVALAEIEIGQIETALTDLLS